jgi:hypothetical protein
MPRPGKKRSLAQFRREGPLQRGFLGPFSLPTPAGRGYCQKLTGAWTLGARLMHLICPPRRLQKDRGLFWKTFALPWKMTGGVHF